MELKDNVQTFHATSRKVWQQWLSKNHDKEKSVYLIIYDKGSDVDSITYPEAVDEAICFGWIDSVVKKRDDKSRYQYFVKRNPKSNWSKVNKEKVARLLAGNLITKAGENDRTC
jgi:uncharacterized protein YdeI (YjbR/CyaY-like superfamily)